MKGKKIGTNSAMQKKTAPQLEDGAKVSDTIRDADIGKMFGKYKVKYSERNINFMAKDRDFWDDKKFEQLISISKRLGFTYAYERQDLIESMVEDQDFWNGPENVESLINAHRSINYYGVKELVSTMITNQDFWNEKENLERFLNFVKILKGFKLREFSPKHR